MIVNKPHISVCICTYKRPQFLRRLLEELAGQDTGGLFTYSIVVADNDESRSAQEVLAEFAADRRLSITYCVEPKQNISLARNAAVANAKGDFVAFIDDDEFPIRKWLLTLFKACCEYDVDGVLGSVKPHFDEQPPSWIIKGKFYNRPSYPTGFVIDGKKGRTGNTLLKAKLFKIDPQPFKPEFRAAEDQDFFTRMIERGHVFIWCHEATAYESIPPVRWRRSFLLRRALLRGATAVIRPNFGIREVAKSIIAVPTYLVALPVAFFLGQHHFMTLLVKVFDHLGKLLALRNLNPVREPYVTE